MAMPSDLGEWLRGAIDWVFDTGRRLIAAGKDALSNLPLPSLPSGNGGGSGGTTPGTPGPSGGGSSPDVPSSGGGNFFSDTIHVLRHLVQHETWERVGIVILGAVLILIAIAIMLQGKRPIQAIMEKVGIY